MLRSEELWLESHEIEKLQAEDWDILQKVVAHTLVLCR